MLFALTCTPFLTAAADAGCTGDLNSDGLVDGADLGELLAAWGTNGAADLDGSGVVDGADVGLLLGAFGVPCGGPIRAELAGNRLNLFPYFDFVATFNAGSLVWLGVDPLRYPTLAGATVDAYVVAHRSEAEWGADPSLSDVRADGPQAVAIVGTSIADNQFPLDNGALPSSDGLSPGMAYDVVLDVDGNGQLGAGDLIDGLGGAGGFFVVPDLAAAGPLAVSTVNYTVTGVTSGFSSERCYYPTNIADLGALPMVVIGHGNGHLYTWYDWIGTHLASWGYVVMSHQNNTQPGIEAASTTTLLHTQAFIAQHGNIAGGALAGHVDTDTIIWMGHSRGGEGVVRAYDRVFDGTFTPTNFTIDDIKLVSSIAPTDFLGTNSANPHAVDYHLIYGSADGDVCGCPNNDVADSFNLFERAAGWRASTYVHGADHNDFNCCGFNDFQGPSGTQIGRPEAQRVGKGAYLALLKNRIEGNEAVREFLFRQYETLRPISVAPETTVVNDLLEGPVGGIAVIDDYQTNTDSGTSSSGGAVSFTVLNLAENKLNDANTTFTWISSDAFNGMVRGRSSDIARALVFDYQAPSIYEIAIPPALADFAAFERLSLRVAQGTRHPRTTAELGNLSFNVVLRDTNGAESSINISAYGGGVQEPYQRTGFGTGAGWQNEFEVIRIRLTDFLADGNPIDLSSIASLRLDLGVEGTSAQGRLSIDDVMLVPD